MGAPEDQAQPVKAQLGMWDAVSIIIGIVIGSTIFRSPQYIFGSVSTPWMGLLAWTLGGALSLIGALCYAELASTYPRAGGDYYFLSRAFGSWLGFLFGWAQLVVVLTASTGAMAFVFADYAVPLWKLEADWSAPMAIAAVLSLTVLNFLGVIVGKWMQNVLSLIKVLGLVAILVTGLMYGSTGGLASEPLPSGAGFGLAMILVLYAYGGWNDAAFVAAEVKQPKNIVGALLLGTLGITIIYVLVNVAFLTALGFEGVRNSQAVAASVAKKALGEDAEKAISVLVMISALGAINGLIFTGSRVYAALGSEHSVFAFLGHWNPRFGAPLWSLATQAVVTVAMILSVGTDKGRSLFDDVIYQIGMGSKYYEFSGDALEKIQPDKGKLGAALGKKFYSEAEAKTALDSALGAEADKHRDALLASAWQGPIPWGDYFGGFATLVAGTAPVFWGFFLLSGLSLFALRQRDPDIIRPFVVPLYPIIPMIFCGTCFYMLFQSLSYAKTLAWMGGIPLLLGLPLFYLSRERAAQPPTEPSPPLPAAESPAEPATE